MSTDLITVGPRALVRSDGHDAEVKLRRSLRNGMITVGVLVVGLGGLAALVPITGAIIAPGEVSVESHIKHIGHPTGGVIAQVFVKDGDRVKAGQVLMRLDTTVNSANSSFTGENVDQLLAHAARLTAERDELPSIVFPAELTGRSSDKSIADTLRAESRNFELRRAARVGQKAQIAERIRQTQAQISSFRAQSSSFRRQAALLDQELGATRSLYEERYTTLDRLNALERAAVGVHASAEGADNSARESLARIAELQQQADSLNRDMRSAAATELLEVQSKIAELRRTKVTADDSLARSTIVAPQAGVVDKLAYTTIGGIIPAGETILEIVPDTDQFIVRVHVRTNDIDKVSVGRTAALRFSAFSARTTPEITGKVSQVAADRTVEPQTGQAYYMATIEIPVAERRKLGDLALVAGMPVETFIQGSDQTLLGYVIKPLSDQLRRAFRQD